MQKTTAAEAALKTGRKQEQKLHAKPAEAGGRRSAYVV
jgi:hypothetical protein